MLNDVRTYRYVYLVPGTCFCVFSLIFSTNFKNKGILGCAMVELPPQSPKATVILVMDDRWGVVLVVYSTSAVCWLNTPHAVKRRHQVTLTTCVLGVVVRMLSLFYFLPVHTWYLVPWYVF